MDLARDAGEVADRLDELVKPAREPENAVLTDNARVVRWAGPAFVLFALILLPWIAYLANSLPSRQHLAARCLPLCRCGVSRHA